MKDIEQYLRENAPDIPDEGQFIIETNARLDAVEGIKKTVEGERRSYRIAILTALIAGLVLGCLATALIFLYPVQPAQIDRSLLEKAVESLQQWKIYIFGFIALCAVALGVMSLTGKREVL